MVFLQLVCRDETKVLQENSGVRAIGINAEEFMKMNSATKEGRL